MDKVLIGNIDLEKEVKEFFKKPVEEAIKNIAYQAIKSPDGESEISVDTMTNIGVHVTITITAKKAGKNESFKRVHGDDQNTQACRSKKGEKTNG